MAEKCSLRGQCLNASKLNSASSIRLLHAPGQSPPLMQSFHLLMDANWGHEPFVLFLVFQRRAIFSGAQRKKSTSLRRLLPEGGGSWVAPTSNLRTRIGAMNPGHSAFGIRRAGSKCRMSNSKVRMTQAHGE